MGAEGIIRNVAYEREVIPFSVEISAVEWQQKVVKNILKYLGIIGGEPELPNEYRLVKGIPQYARHGGFWSPNVKVRDEVKKGDRIGTLVDVFGEVTEDVKATHDGIVCSLRHFPETNPGNELVGCYDVVEVMPRS